MSALEDLKKQSAALQASVSSLSGVANAGKQSPGRPSVKKSVALERPVSDKSSVETQALERPTCKKPVTTSTAAPKLARTPGSDAVAGKSARTPIGTRKTMPVTKPTTTTTKDTTALPARKTLPASSAATPLKKLPVLPARSAIGAKRPVIAAASKFTDQSATSSSVARLPLKTAPPRKLTPIPDTESLPIRAASRPNSASANRGTVKKQPRKLIPGAVGKTSGIAGKAVDSSVGALNDATTQATSGATTLLDGVTNTTRQAADSLPQAVATPLKAKTPRTTTKPATKTLSSTSSPVPSARQASSPQAAATATVIGIDTTGAALEGLEDTLAGLVSLGSGGTNAGGLSPGSWQSASFSSERDAGASPRRSAAGRGAVGGSEKSWVML